MLSTLNHIKTLVEQKYGQLEIGRFYNIEDLKIKIETLDGYKPVKSFVVKEGISTFVNFEDGSSVRCASNHFFMTPTGQQFASALNDGDEVVTKNGAVKVKSVVYGDRDEFYDLEVDSDEHTYLTANGINHHNTGKTQTVEEMLAQAGKSEGEGYVKITGSASPVGVYRLLYQNRNQIILFDDSDSALADQEARNLFKAASDTKPKRKLNWMKGGKNFVAPEDFDEDSDDDTLPRSFEFTGKIIFISNLALNKLDPDGALRTRAYVIDIDPTNEEIYDFMMKICKVIPLDVDSELSEEERKEVVEVLRSRKIADKTANLRSLVRALNTRAGVELQGGTREEWIRFVKMFA